MSDSIDEAYERWYRAEKARPGLGMIGAFPDTFRAGYEAARSANLVNLQAEVDQLRAQLATARELYDVASEGRGRALEQRDTERAARVRAEAALELVRKALEAQARWNHENVGGHGGRGVTFETCTTQACTRARAALAPGPAKETP